jgi:hypothetical protein
MEFSGAFFAADEEAEAEDQNQREGENLFHVNTP